MPLYFAYGANMDVAGMARRCPGSRPLGVATLPRHRWIITAAGYASVIPDARRSVPGVLWDLALADVAALDRFEEAGRGLYAKTQRSVIVAAGPRRALVYVGAVREVGRPRPGYLEDVIAAAAHWNLPDAHMATMQGYRGGAWPEPPRDRPVAARQPADTWRWGS
jgi:hypothetical protein